MPARRSGAGRAGRRFFGETVRSLRFFEKFRIPAVGRPKKCRRQGTTVPRPGGRLSGLFAGIFAGLSLRSGVGSSLPCPAPTGRTSPQEDRRTCFSRVGRADGWRKDRADENRPKYGTERHRSAGAGGAGCLTDGLSARRLRASRRRTMRTKYEKAGSVLPIRRTDLAFFSGRFGGEPLRRTALPLFSSLRPDRGRSGRRPTGGGSAGSCRI